MACFNCHALLGTFVSRSAGMLYLLSWHAVLELGMLYLSPDEEDEVAGFTCHVMHALLVACFTSKEKKI